MGGVDVVAAVDANLTEHFGHAPSRASVSFVGVDPIDVLRFVSRPGEFTYVSLGMSRHVMTDATDLVRSADGPRAELLLRVHADDRFADVWRRVAMLAATPAVEGVVYAPGMTVSIEEPIAAGSQCTGVVVVEAGLGPIGTSDGSVDILSIVPATLAELAWARVRGSAALVECWAEQHIDLLDLGRRGAVLRP